jgi:CubicO group peptidase (beta-lactamase class C family)
MASTSASAAADKLELIRAKHKLPALAFVVVKDGQIVDRAACGVRKHGESTPVTTEDVWHIGSCTKSMTSTLAAISIERGQLRWDTTITEVLPHLTATMDSAYASVTVEQLLTHRSGLATSPPGEYVHSHTTGRDDVRGCAVVEN